MKKNKIVLIFIFFVLLILHANFVYAAEQEVKNYDELKNAIADNTVTEIILSEDINVTEDNGENAGFIVKRERNIVLDLNGKTLSMESSKTNTSYLINNQGTLTIKDSTDINKTGEGSGKIIYNSNDPDMNSIPSYASNTITNSGMLIIESGLIENTTKSAPAAYVIDNNNSGHDAILTINGGKIDNLNNWGIRMFANSNTNENNVQVNNGSINGGVWLQTVSSKPKANFLLNNGNITGSKYGVLICTYSPDAYDVNVTINGGIIEANPEKGNALYIYDKEANSNVEINGGTFNAYLALIYYAYNQSNLPTTIINNGIFNGYIELDQKFVTNPEENYESNFCINNGKFLSDINVWAYDGSNWYLSTNTKFIKGGVFATIEDGEEECYWPEFIVEPYEVTNVMKSTPNGYPYTIGHKITLNANYENGENSIIYTLTDGSMSELEDINREGYKFLGWNTKQDGTGEKITKNSIITENTNLYAQWEIIPGEIEMKLSASETIDISADTNEINDAILTDEEKEQINEGKNIKIEIIVEDVTEKISTEEKEKIVEKMEDKIIGAYIDISIIKTVEGEEKETITNTNGKVKFTISIPDELIDEENPNREFYIVRMHDEKVEILNTEYDSENHTLTFETDKFSTYAIAYTDKQKNIEDKTEQEEKNDTDLPKENTPEEKNETENKAIENNKTQSKETDNIYANPKTGDNGISVFAKIMIISILGIIITVKILKNKKIK